MIKPLLPALVGLTQWPGGTWRRMVQVAGMVALAAALLIALVPGTTSLVVFVLLTLWCHGPLSPLLPAAYEPVLLGYGRVFPPLLLAITGATASTAIEYVNYHLYRKLLKVERLDRILVSPATRRLMGPFLRRPFLTVWLCVLTPLPDWAARILASHSRYSVRSYLAAVLLARVPRFWFLAALGFHLELGAGVVLSIIAASAVLALIGLWRRQPTPASPQPGPGAVLLLLGLLSAPLPLSSLEAQEARSGLAGPAKGVSMDWFMEGRFRAMGPVLPVLDSPAGWTCCRSGAVALPADASRRCIGPRAGFGRFVQRAGAGWVAADQGGRQRYYGAGNRRRSIRSRRSRRRCSPPADR